jgi:hypothetical protein
MRPPREGRDTWSLCVEAESCWWWEHPGQVAFIFFFLDITLKGDGDANARQIVRALGEQRAGKGFFPDAREAHYTDPEDPTVNAWKFEYVDFEDRAAALESLVVDLDRIDAGWRDCLVIS